MKGVSTLYWRKVGSVLVECQQAALHPGEAEYARRALTFLREKSVGVQELKDN